MKNKLAYLQKKIGVVLLFSMVYVVPLTYGQSLSTSYYGIWDRGEGVVDYSDPKAAFVLGIETTALWEDIQKTGPNDWDFTAFQQTLNTAVLNNKLVRFSINVGPESPMWIFANGVPLVNVKSNATKNDKYANRYPYYLNATYKDFYFKMIEQFALFLRNQPEEKFKHIAFVQVKTGSTGDEEAYKGTAIDPLFIISPTNWEKFRLEAFTQFKKCFNDVPDHKIVLTFNNVDPDQQPEAYNFVMNDLDPIVGFGIKGGAYNRGHHLSDEQTYKEQWNPFLINPKPGPLNPKGVKLFSASEMDQSWKKGFFALNYEIGFYWAALGGINTGVSCTNVSVSAMEYAFANPGIIEIFKMYNRYAQQVYPETATTVFSIFHEGLNAADYVKFPIKDYNGEPAVKSNVKRYLAIVNSPKYYNRGARIEDQLAVVAGQVYQRESQDFYNDAGWEICEGNIERFFTQIKPDSTSIGLFRVRGAITSTSSKYDRFARSFEHATGKDTMFFKFDREVFASAKPKSLQFKIIWLDKTVGSNWSFRYKSPQGIVDAIQVSGMGDNTWKEVTFTLNDAIIDESGIYGSDFMLVNTDTIDDIFNGIEIGIERENTTGIPPDKIENDIAVQVYPNPTKSIINIKSSQKIESVEVCDLGGKLRMNTIHPKNSIDLSSLQNGMYFLKISTDNGMIVTKMIKE